MLSKVKFVFRKPLYFFILLVTKPIPYFRFLYEQDDYQTKVNFKFWFVQKVLNVGGNKEAYWPVHWTSKVYDVKNIRIGVDSAPGNMGGAYITGIGGIEIGNYCLFAKNVVIVTANHDLYDSRIRQLSPVKIGNYCWLGAGAKIMPGVELGDNTIVAAGAVVTKSFSEGYCIVAGIPAKKIRDIEKDKCVHFNTKHKFHGYVKVDKYS